MALNVRFQTSYVRRVDDLEVVDPVRPAPCGERLELGDVFGRSGDDQLAGARMGDVVLSAEVVQAPSPLHAKLGFQGVRGVVDAGMNDTTVVRAGVESEPTLPLE